MNHDELEEKIGHSFAQPSLLDEALTHATWLKEQRDRGQALDQRDQQRLEYLGDAFLGFAVGEHLFAQLPDADEGELTARRKSLVRGTAIRQVGEELGLEALLRIGTGEVGQLARNKKFYEDTVEALIGAVLVDAGVDAARKVVHHLLLRGDGLGDAVADPISQYNQRWQQVFRKPPPKVDYASEGEEHQTTWTATVRLPDDAEIRGVGASRKAARSAACAAALERWNDA